jgi:pyruvate,water dikinase
LSGVLFHQSIYPITNFVNVESIIPFFKEFKFESDKKEYKVVISNDGSDKSYFDLKLNDFEGKCIVHYESDESFFEYKNQTNDDLMDRNIKDLVISLNDEFSNEVSISGGKGSSLRQLIELRNSRDDHDFDVPMGCVVTTNAYQLVNKNEQLEKEIDYINKFEKFVWIKDKNVMKNKCLKLEAMVSQLEMPEVIKNDIEKNLINIFKSKNIDEIQFSVRSSATAEDSQEMSWAGQMKTYLGVKGLQNIYSCVMKCWASQFTYIAMQYKLEYGQAVNVPMAVVVQEMVDCDCAGVAFSCDPITGDGRKVVITANYGLGEVYH